MQENAYTWDFPIGARKFSCIKLRMRTGVTMVNKVEICGVNTAKLPLYKEAEMMQMIEKIQAGDQAVRDEFIKGNLRLVLSVIQRFSNRGENPDDLFQVGCIGLIKALDNFDLSHGVKFSTYAVADDHRRDPPLSQRQQCDPRFALDAGPCVQGAADQGAALQSAAAGAERGGDRQGYGDRPGGHCAGIGIHSGAGLAV